ncbi:unnamed protein product [Arctia plantaginis]|uniref:ABC-type xenobiotic transporter n=1 Tax=Arctia plantaginis TaxID=874455 RepID=A0A8S0ZPF1_ARCPL|nr:unnamed protein product [Arctia plantaginis]
MWFLSKPQDGDGTLSISYLQLFRYGTTIEKLATCIGIFLGILSGGGISINLALLGEINTAFVERTHPPTDRYSTNLPILSTFGGGTRLFNATHEENMAALVQDGIALTICSFVTVGMSLLLTTLSIGLIGWSALRQITTIRILFLKSVLRQDMSWFDTDTEFNLASKMSENITKIKEGMGEKLGAVSNLIGTSLFCLCISFPLGWELTLACATLIPFCVAAAVALTSYQTKSAIREMESYSQAGKHAEEIMKSVRTVVAFGGENKEVDRYSNLLQPAEQYGCKRGFYSGLGNGFNWILTFCLNAIGITYGARLVIRDMYRPEEEQKYFVGVVLSILFNISMATQSLTVCIPHIEVFAAARGAATGIFQLLDKIPKIDSSAKTGISPESVLGEITLDNVNFSYPSRPDMKILNSFSATIKPGECVALVGSSGCGKSTVLQLLQRLYDPLSGSIKLDGTDLNKINLKRLRSCLGVVGQEPVLFSGTIFENIAIGYEEATQEEVERVASIAYAHDFIKNLPMGYNTVIGERGASLSGGQKQRIAIARSLLRDPPVLLLDEATSALDPHSERQVQVALDRASVGRTTIMVSHRLATIVNAERIICMDKGVIVEQGTHEELIKMKGFYYNLVVADNQGNDKFKPLEEIVDLAEGIEEENDIENDTKLRIDDIRNDRRKYENRRRMQRQNSVKDYQGWMTPGGSISSAMSVGYQVFMQHDESETKNEEDELAEMSEWQILKLNSPEWIYTTIGALAAIGQGACFPVFALLLGLVTSIFVLKDHNELLYFADLYAGLFVLVSSFAGLCMLLQSFTFTRGGLKMTTRLRTQYFAALLRQEIGFYDNQNNTVGAICGRLSGDTAEVQGATGLRIGIILQGISSVAIGIAMGMLYDWRLTLVSSTFLPLMVGSIWLEGRISRKSQLDERKAMEAATSVATEAVVSIKTVQSLGIEEVFLRKFEQSLHEGCSAILPKLRWRGLVLGMGIYMSFLSPCCANAYGAARIATGSLDYKVVILVTEALIFGAYILGQTLVYAPSMTNAKRSAARIVSVIKREPVVKTESCVNDDKDWAASGSFSLNEVEFSYPTRKKHRVLRGINLRVESGKTVALVGSSGCGKSTILQLMQRFYDPDSGTIELDGANTRTALTLPRLRQQLGVVQQEPVLFDRTVAENIAYGDNTRKVEISEIIEACKAANIHAFITSLPDGYDTNLGASGAQLSGGQKQRVCIARALVRSPRLLLLDEATSALDTSSEQVVAEALEVAAKGRTCITIAHRLSTIKNSDIICVLEKGRIVERGNHEQLVKMQGLYYNMCKGQNMT